MIENDKEIIKHLNMQFKKLEQDILISNNFPTDKCIDSIFSLMLGIDNVCAENRELFEQEYERIKGIEIKKFTKFINKKKDEFIDFFEDIKGICPDNYFDYYKELKGIYLSKVQSLKEEKLRKALEELSFMDDIFMQTLDLKFEKFDIDKIFDNIRGIEKEENYDNYSYRELSKEAHKNGFDIRRLSQGYAVYKNMNDKVLIIPQGIELGRCLKISIAKKISLG